MSLFDKNLFWRLLASRIHPIAACLTLPILISCKSSAPPAKSPQASYSKPLVREVTEWDQYPGRLQSPETVNLSARVSGIIEKAPFVEGSKIKAGDILFYIDPRPFQADLQSKEADILSAQAQLAQAQTHFKRYSGLKGTEAISGEDYDQALAELQQSKAKVAAAEAARDIARLNLEWTKVTAPISGLVSKKLVTEGNLVSAGVTQASQLTTITSIDPIYCYANIPESALFKYKLAIQARQKMGLGEELPCRVELENENSFAHLGSINFIDNKVDPTTGTVEIRCSLPNKDELMGAGLFARLQLPGSAPYQAILIPDSAISTDQNSRYVLTINNENIIVRQSVELGPLFGKLRSIKSGVKAEDRVLINGLQLLRPGTAVIPQEQIIESDKGPTQ